MSPASGEGINIKTYLSEHCIDYYFHCEILVIF